MQAAPACSPDRPRSLKTHASAAECRVIEARAECAGLSVSAYLRAAALGRAVRARGTSDAVDALCDLVREVSGLGEMVRDLAAAAGCAERATEVLRRVDAARDALAEAAGRL